MPEDILCFIDRFTWHGKLKDTIITFTQGCCYWFAWILHTRFPQSQIRYDPVDGHFVTRIAGRDYDIRGDVTGRYQSAPWECWTDELEKARILRDCVDFIECKEE